MKFVAALVQDQLSEPVKHLLDFFAVGALVATLLAWLPAITAVLVFVWTVLRIYESVLTIRLKQRELRE